MHCSLRHLFITLVFAGALPIAGAAKTIERAEEIRADGVVLKGHSYLREGLSPGKPVLLLHGSLSNERHFMAYVDHLAATGSEAFSFNLPGHGNGDDRSYIESPVQGDYTFEHFYTVDAPLMVREIRKRTGRRPTIIGYSLGAMVALASDSLGFMQDDLDSIVAINTVPLQKQLAAQIDLEAAKQAAQKLKAAVGIVQGPFGPFFNGIIEVYTRNIIAQLVGGGLFDANNFEWGQLSTLVQQALNSGRAPGFHGKCNGKVFVSVY